MTPEISDSSSSTEKVPLFVTKQLVSAPRGVDTGVDIAFNGKTSPLSGPSGEQVLELLSRELPKNAKLPSLEEVNKLIKSAVKSPSGGATLHIKGSIEPNDQCVQPAVPELVETPPAPPLDSLTMMPPSTLSPTTSELDYYDASIRDLIQKVDDSLRSVDDLGECLQVLRDEKSNTPVMFRSCTNGERESQDEWTFFSH